MDLSAIAISLAVSLLSGAGGVVLGSVVTLKERGKEEDRLNRGVARVTYMELQENGEYLEAAIKRSASVPTMARTWPETRARLAAMLSPSDFVVVASAYSHITTIDLSWQSRPLGSGLSANGLSVATATLAKVVAAKAILLSEGWPRLEDRAELQAKIDE